MIRGAEREREKVAAEKRSVGVKERERGKRSRGVREREGGERQPERGGVREREGRGAEG